MTDLPDWELEPNHRIGGVVFGRPLSQAMRTATVRSRHHSGPGNEVRLFRDNPDGNEHGVDAVFLNDDGIVELVQCVRHCELNGVDLIGADRDVLSTLFGDIALTVEPDSEVPYLILECQGLGLSFWLLDGRVVSVGCMESETPAPSSGHADF